MSTAVGASKPSVQIHAHLNVNNESDVTNVMQNVQNALSSLAASAQGILQNLSAQSGGAAGGGSAAASLPGAFSAPGIDSGAWNAKFDQMAQVGAMLDNMEQEATKLMQSPNKADQIKGQQMMAAMQQIMEAIIKAIQATSQVAKDAIQGSVR